MNNTWLVIAGMTLVTVVPRVLPLLLLPGRKMPRSLERWLSLVVPAVLAAFLLPDLVLRRGVSGEPVFSLWSIELLAALPAFLAARKTKGLFGAIAAGMAAVALLRLL